MNQFGNRAPGASLDAIGLSNVANAYWNLLPAELVEESVILGMGQLTANGALAIETGAFTGRSPKDRFIVEDSITRDSVWWGDINIPFSSEAFDRLHKRMCAYLSNRDVYVRDAFACDHPEFRMPLRAVTEYPWSNQFVYNMFLRPSADEIQSFTPEWTVICAPGFQADPAIDGTRQSNFAVINFSQKMILVGGTGYTGEIKKGIFSVLNFLLPYTKGVLSMHCSANIGEDGETAVFFGLSGTGKTTLSSDENRHLIGDDEHGWSADAVFNFEGGCYAKTIDLSREKEPQIWDAIRFGAILENIGYADDGVTPDYADDSITPNTRVSYPIHHINNIAQPSRGGIPKNIFFLTCDAFGVLPPISKLTKGQAMYHFISGYTAKVAGTEEGVNEPQAAFSACFGAPFLPLHPNTYAEMLGDKMEAHDVNVWLVNTGWSGGAYGVGSRMKLKYTRAMITAALNGELEGAEYEVHEVFGLNMPKACPGVPTELLNPRKTWEDVSAYDQKAQVLAQKFNTNFEPFAEACGQHILDAAPKVKVNI